MRFDSYMVGDEGVGGQRPLEGQDLFDNLSVEVHTIAIAKLCPGLLTVKHCTVI